MLRKIVFLLKTCLINKKLYNFLLFDSLFSKIKNTILDIGDKFKFMYVSLTIKLDLIKTMNQANIFISL